MACELVREPPVLTAVCMALVLGKKEALLVNRLGSHNTTVNTDVTLQSHKIQYRSQELAPGCRSMPVRLSRSSLQTPLRSLAVTDGLVKSKTMDQDSRMKDEPFTESDNGFCL
ncbi:hypothetical protein BJ166DRAFT_493732 [Pestalotiopsis sp. NC0098]|nr:hypothetical protein BJ166DRAFT_493732 [Pestalotiopsis sp. NC0098]